MIAVVLLLGGFLLFKGRDAGKIGGSVTSGELKRTDPRSGEIVVEGKLGCLPLKSGETPSGDTCIVGLVGNDNKYYAIDTANVEVLEKGIDIDTTVRIIGKYVEADTDNAEAGIFTYDGVITVRVMQNQSK